MRFVRVIFEDGNTLDTSITGTEDEIRAYYIGKPFNIGANEDHITIGKYVLFLDMSPAHQLHDALKLVHQSMLDNDTSADKSHPWIPGADAVHLKRMIGEVFKQVEGVPA